MESITETNITSKIELCCTWIQIHFINDGSGFGSGSGPKPEETCQMDLDLVLKFWIEFWFPSCYDSTSIYIPKEQVSNPSTIATSWGPMIWIKHKGKIILYWSKIQFQPWQLCVSSSSSSLSFGKKSCEHPMCLIMCLLGDLAECAIKMWFPFDSHWSQLNIHLNGLNC